jgi:hypothetical protein
MILLPVVILVLIKHYRKFAKDFIGLLVKKMLKIGVDLVQFVLQRKVHQIKATIR